MSVENSVHTDGNRSRLVALAVTAILCVLVCVMLAMLSLDYTSITVSEKSCRDSSEILFGGEYVMTGDIPLPELNENISSLSEKVPVPAVEGITDAGVTDKATPSSLVASRHESEIKTVSNTDNSESLNKEREEQARKRREEETAANISKRVSFGVSSGSGEVFASGKSGSPDGNAPVGDLSGMPGTSLNGRTLASWSKPSATATGTIVVSVRVSRDGRVLRASYISGDGAVASSVSARRSCEQAARQSRFSVDMNAAAEQTGTITYRFK